MHLVEDTLTLVESKLPKSSQWLNGEGAGCYLHLEGDLERENRFRIRRFNDLGELEFDLFFNLQGGSIDLDNDFEFTYPCHALKCVVNQNDEQLVFISESA